jgi:hypothetical protein
MAIGESGRLVVTALVAGLLGGALGVLVATPREAAWPAPPAVDMAPLTAAIQDLERVLQEASTRQQPPDKIDQASEDGEPPVRTRVPGVRDAAAAGPSVDRFVSALQAAVARLEKLAEGEHRTTQLVAMTESMSRISRVPPRLDAVLRLPNLDSGKAGQDFLYLSSAEVVERLGSPVYASADSETGLVKWVYSPPAGRPGLRLAFFGNRVVMVDSW